MGTIFNSKIKMKMKMKIKIKISLLILMWTLICRRQYSFAVNADQEQEQRSLAVHNDNDIDVYNPEGLSKHNGSTVDVDVDVVVAVEQVAKDQLGGINKTLSVQTTLGESLYGGHANDTSTKATKGKTLNENSRKTKQTEMTEVQNDTSTKVNGKANGENVPTESVDNENSVMKGKRVYADDIAGDNDSNDSNDDNDGNDGNEPANVSIHDASVPDEHDEPDGTAATNNKNMKAGRYRRTTVLFPTDEADVTGALQYQLIYEFAIKYKQIPRITYFTCRNGNSNGDAVNSNERIQQRQQQSWLSFNMRTMKLLRQMNAATSTSTSTSTETTGRRVASPKAPKAPKIPMTEQTHNGNGYNNDGNGDGNGNGDGDNGDSNDDDDGNSKLTRPTMIFGKKQNTTQSLLRAKANSSSTAKKNRESILIKVVQIDQLVKACSYKSSTSINSTSCCPCNRRNSQYSNGAKNCANRSCCNMHSNAADMYPCASTNWLDAVLRPNMLRQIIVLDLSCGAASRKLIEMASRRGLFSCAYHWLLIEDYTFNGQTSNDGDDNGDGDGDGDDGNNIKNNNFNNDGNKTNSNIKVGITNRKQQRQQAFELHQSRDQQQHQHQQTIDDAAKLSLNNIKNIVVGNQQREANIKFNATVDSTPARARARLTTNESSAFSDAIKDEEDMQIIEKFLEKINININTELILAKRKRTDMCNERLRKQHNRRAKDKREKDSNIKMDDCSMPLQKKDYFMLYDVWNPGLYYGGQLNISEIGQFTLDDGLRIATWYRRSNTVTRRKNMKLARIRSIMVITNKNHRDTLEHYLTTHYDTHLDSMHRFNFALLSLVRDLYNFSLITTSTASWGYLRNGRFDGMIGAVVRKQADICGSPMFFYIERARVTDYTAKTWEARPCFIFRHPRNAKTNRIVFLEPFQNKVWILLIISGISTIILLWFLKLKESELNAAQQFMNLKCTENREKGAVKKGKHVDRQEALRKETGNTYKQSIVGRWATVSKGKLGFPTTKATTTKISPSIAFNKEQKNARKKRRSPKVSSTKYKRCTLQLFDAFIYYVGTICQQGLTFSTSFISGRCIVITSLLFSFTIYQFYSASIVGTLLMERPKTIRTLRDLVRSPLEIGIEDIPYNRDYFLRTKDPDAIDLYTKKMINTEMSFNFTNKHDAIHSHEVGAHAQPTAVTNWFNAEEGVARMREGKFAFHADLAAAYKLISETFDEKQICELTEIELFPVQNTVSCVQKGSPLRKMITYGLRRVIEAGLMDYQRKIWHSPKPRCVRKIHTDDLHVDMETVTSAVILLLFGYVLSLMVFGFEILHDKLWRRFSRKTNGLQ